MEFTKEIADKIWDIYRIRHDCWDVKRELGIPISELRPFIKAIRFSGVGQWWFGLSRSAIRAAEAIRVESRDGLMEAYSNGKLFPGRIRLYGWKTHKEIAKWLGLPEPVKMTNKFKEMTIKRWNEAIEACVDQVMKSKTLKEARTKMLELRK